MRTPWFDRELVRLFPKVPRIRGRGFILGLERSNCHPKIRQMRFNCAPDLRDVGNIMSAGEQSPDVDDVLDGRPSLRKIGIVPAETIQRFADPLEIAFSRILRLLVAAPEADGHVCGVSQDPVAGSFDIIKQSQSFRLHRPARDHG